MKKWWSGLSFTFPSKTSHPFSTIALTLLLIKRKAHFGWKLVAVAFSIPLSCLKTKAKFNNSSQTSQISNLISSLIAIAETVRVGPEQRKLRPKRFIKQSICQNSVSSSMALSSGVKVSILFQWSIPTRKVLMFWKLLVETIMLWLLQLREYLVGETTHQGSLALRKKNKYCIRILKNSLRKWGKSTPKD